MIQSRSVAVTWVRPAPAWAQWPAPQAYTVYSTSGGAPGIGPGPGNQPNGVYQVITRFTAPVSGVYTWTLAADDGAAAWLDGQLLGTATFASGRQGGTVSVSQGSHWLWVTVTNNSLGSPAIVGYGTGSPNPTGVAVTLTDPSGQTVVSTASAQGWHYSGYLTNVAAGTVLTAVAGPPGTGSGFIPV